MIGKLIKGIFGGSAEPKSTANPPVTYDSFEIIAEPKSAGGQWQVAGRIEKEIAGERKTHTFIRADTMPSQDEAASEMLRKAKVMIDQQGDSIFHG